MAKVQTYINTPEMKFTWVKVYDADTGDDLAQFDCFYLATDFIVQGDYAIIHVKDRHKQSGQLWGIRKRQP